ncbi:hypothetical protein DSO57_1027971 [Entomophthora muscae]|uniref:Uncharacterized protein n=1 Tax=Entomophthora muscae TaxID=34485 RepID=A0ACC2UMG7_9FUNG|nr:hypothetical protein DSO57_1027971 [Entomophthora muscae]
MTCAIGTYSALPMQFGKLLLAAPAFVLENESYNFLVGYEVLLIFEESVKVPRKRLKMCVLEYPTDVFTLKYCTHSSNMKCPPMACPASERIPLLATSAISYELPEHKSLELYSPPLLGHKKTYLCSGILDVSHKVSVQLLVDKLTALPIVIPSYSRYYLQQVWQEVDELETSQGSDDWVDGHQLMKDLSMDVVSSKAP